MTSAFFIRQNISIIASVVKDSGDLYRHCREKFKLVEIWYENEGEP